MTTIVWQKADSPRNSARLFSTDHDFILVYSKNPTWVPLRLPRSDESDSIYSNPDDDPRGLWLPGDPYANKPYSKGRYTITGPRTPAVARGCHAAQGLQNGKHLP